MPQSKQTKKNEPPAHNKKRYKLHPYPTSAMKELFAAIGLIRSEKEAVEFFRDLLTIAELEEFSNRWQMVKKLYQGTSYLEIAKELEVSTTTVTRVAQWFREGTGGYRTMAKRAFGKDHDHHERPKLRGKLRGMPNPYSM